jgi:hypothetical protein
MRCRAATAAAELRNHVEQLVRHLGELAARSSAGL